MSELNLSALRPDYEDIRAQLQAGLAARNSWAGLLPTQSGQTLIDYIASVGAFAQMKAMRYHQDSFSETAVAERALYAIADMQGLRQPRKSPASATVDVTYIKPPTSSATSLTINGYSQFQAAGAYWFTSGGSVVVQDGQTVSITVYEGFVIDSRLPGLGTDFQTFISEEAGFSVSDLHVQVTINGTQFLSKATSGLWNKKGEPAYRDSTTPDGRLLIQFGNSTFGYKPLPTDEVRIRYGVTSGLDGNDIITLGNKLTLTGNSTFSSGWSFVFTSNPTGGSNEPPGDTYKRISSTNFGSFGSAVTKTQYLGALLEESVIIDAKTFAQRELDPTDYRLMNTIKVVALTTTPLNSSQRSALLTRVENKSMYSTQLYWAEPTVRLSTVKARIYCYSYATLTECATDATLAVQALFAKKRGILGYDIMLSDINAAILGSNSGIEYIDMITPTEDLMVSGTPIAAPRAFFSTTFGAVTAGSYTYGIYVVDSLGNIPALNLAQITVSGTTPGHVTLFWDPYPGGAEFYGIIGRVGDSLGRIALVPGTTLSFVDNGEYPISTDPLPRAADYPVAYNSLSSVPVITAEYSNRRS